MLEIRLKKHIRIQYVYSNLRINCKKNITVTYIISVFYIIFFIFLLHAKQTQHKMQIIRWSNSFNCNIEEIDKQHKELVEMLNSLYSAFLDKEHAENIKGIVEEMMKYAAIHFKTEESYFDKFGYSERSVHIAAHASFTDNVRNFADEYNKNKNALTYKVLSFLQNWLIDHILKTDKKFAEEYLAQSK